MTLFRAGQTVYETVIPANSTIAEFPDVEHDMRTEMDLPGAPSSDQSVYAILYAAKVRKELYADCGSWEQPNGDAIEEAVRAAYEQGRADILAEQADTD